MKEKILTLILAILLLMLISCGDKTEAGNADSTETAGVTVLQTESDTPPPDIETTSPQESETEKEPEPEYVNIENIGEYSVIYAKDAPKSIKNAATDLVADIYMETEIMLKARADDAEEVPLEIIIGETSRAPQGYTYGELGMSSYIIKRIGDKIIIDGGSEVAIKGAIKYFCMNFSTESKVRLPYSGEYAFISEGYIDSIKIDGISISEYTVIADLYDVKVAERFTDTLAMATSVNLPIMYASDMKELGEKYILISDVNTDFTTHYVKIENGNIIMSANYKTIDECVDYFFNDMLGYELVSGRIKGEKSIKLTSGMEKIFKLEKKQVYSKEKLLSVLTEVYNSDNIIVGQHMSAYRTGETLTTERALYKENLRVDCPLFGFDVAEAQASSKYTWNAQVKDAYDMVEYAREGGIFTFSSHFNNPSGLPKGLANYRGELGDGTAAAWDLLLTEGTEYNKNFMKDLAYVADFLEIFHSNGVPIIWRPLHEMNGNWFWFCIVNGENDNLIPAEYAAKLWIMIYDYLVSERGLDSLIWEYSPNVASGKLGSESSVMYCYPGDEYCDIVGCDWYTGSYKGHGILAASEKEMKPTGKIFSVTEFGPSGSVRTDFNESPDYKFTCSHLDALIKEVTESGIKTCYWMLWSSWSEVKVSMWNMGHGEFFYENEVYLTLEDTCKLLYD